MQQQFVFYSDSLEKASKIPILHVKIFPVAESAMGKSGRCSYSTKKAFLENTENVIVKQLSPFNKVMSSKFIKKGLQYVSFPTNFAKLLRASFLKHMSR